VSPFASDEKEISYHMAACFIKAYLIEGMVKKPSNVRCYMFLLAILGVDLAQNLVKYKRWLCAFIQLTNRGIAIM